MPQSDWATRLYTTISEELDHSIERIKWDRTQKLGDDLGADSLDVAELAMALEEEFDIQIEDEHVAEWVTVDDVVMTTIQLWAQRNTRT